LLKTDKSHTRVLYSSSIVDLVKRIIFIRKNRLEKIDFYYVPVKELADVINDTETFDNKWLCDIEYSRNSENCENIDESPHMAVYKGLTKKLPEGFAEAQKDVKYVYAPEQTSTHGDSDVESYSHHEESKDSNEDLRFDSDDSEIERGTNE